MKIGTALTQNATKALLLGSGELGKEIAISLQPYGVEVIAVDSYLNAPAQQVAQRSYVIDMTDSDAVKQLITTENPDFIIPEIDAIATEALAEIEVEGISKAELKTAVDNGIGYPCFIKPTMFSSGKGQSMVKSADQLEQAWNYAKAGGRANTGKVIVEGVVDFDFKITLLTVRALNAMAKVETHFCEPIGYVQQDGDYRESWQPQEMTSAAIKNAQDIAFKVTDGIGGLGLFGVELFVKGDDVWFSEVSPRPHDTGMVAMVTQRQTEFDLHARAILNLPVFTALDKTGASAVILGGINAKGVEYTGLNKALADPDVEAPLFAKPEAFVARPMGVALATSLEGVIEARVKAVKAAGLVNVQESVKG